MVSHSISGGNPLVSVIIPCFNHAIYLPKAIESILRQTYTNTEILVVNDGSTDNTETVTQRYPQVKHIYQQNQGLSAARNTGIKESKGECLVFLDADDWLYPRGIEINVSYLQKFKDAAFVSGTYDAMYVDTNEIKEGKHLVQTNHYLQLLYCNYIGMIAAVAFRRWVLDEYKYDTSLRNCEDYDLYLRIARKYPVFHHQYKIAAYRMHSSNMSSNIPSMLQGVLGVLNRQNVLLRSEKETKTLKAGKANWRTYYCKELLDKILKDNVNPSMGELKVFIEHKPSYLLKYIRKRKKRVIKSTLKALTPPVGLKVLHKLGLYKKHKPAVGQINAGDFNRLKPFSQAFGYDRGGPVDRYYIEEFLKKESQYIKGRVLEIGDNEYTMRFGGENITKSDILHVNDKNPLATLVGDISNAPQIPDNTFDCIVLTQTLHLIYNFKDALNTCYRILKPEGVLLLTVPGITPIDHGEWKDTWFWSFTGKGMQRLMAETFPNSTTEVTSYGNVFTATAFLYGMGLPEVPIDKLNYNDPHYPVIVTVMAQKK